MKLEILERSNQIKRLSEKEQKDPREVIAEFFLNYHLKDVREVLWEWLCAGLCHNKNWFQTGMERSNLIFLYENLEKLAEATYLLHGRQHLKRQRKKKNTITKKNSNVNQTNKSNRQIDNLHSPHPSATS